MLTLAEQAQQQLQELIPSKRYSDMASSLSVRILLPASSSGVTDTQAVVHLLEPLRPLTTVAEVATVFKAAENDRKAVQEKVNAEMETLWVWNRSG
jgi:hypothetical protein